MTDETHELLIGAVKDALRPEFDQLHGRITEVGNDTATIKERTMHMPTKADMIAGIQSHAVRCAAGRRWKWGLWVAVPGGLAAIWGLWTAFSGG